MCCASSRRDDESTALGGGCTILGRHGSLALALALALRRLELLKLELLSADHLQQSVDLGLLFCLELLVKLAKTRCSIVIWIAAG